MIVYVCIKNTGRVNPMRHKILITDQEVHFENTLQDLESISDVVKAKSNDENELSIYAYDSDIIVVSCFTKITSKIINSAKKLKAIIKYGVGVDNINIDEATKRGVLVINCPEYGSETIADHAFSLIACLSRNVIKIDRNMRKKGWFWPNPEYMGTDIFGKTLGIIGFGRIGKAMAKRAKGFSMKVIVFDPYIDDETVTQFDVKRVNLDGLLELLDFLSIHCILTPETRGLIGEAELKRMKNDAYLINVSRGEIIDEDALIKALRNGWIAGAGLDVFNDEPLNVNHPLLSFENVIITPHLAWYTKGASKRLEMEAFQRIIEVIDGKIPKNVKNTDVFYLNIDS